MKLKRKEKNILILGLCFVLGIIFLFLSEYDFGEQTDSVNESFDEAMYTQNLESRLAAIIDQMKGVSDVTVMITLEGGVSYHFANQTAKSLSESSSTVETLLPMQEDSKGKSTPILTETKLPAIRGVSVVCAGAADVQIRKRIIGLVASTLNLNENQIFVTE